MGVPGFGATEAEAFEQAALGGDSGPPGSRRQEGSCRAVRSLSMRSQRQQPHESLTDIKPSKSGES